MCFSFWYSFCFKFEVFVGKKFHLVKIKYKMQAFRTDKSRILKNEVL